MKSSKTNHKPKGRPTPAPHKCTEPTTRHAVGSSCTDRGRTDVASGPEEPPGSESPPKLPSPLTFDAIHLTYSFLLPPGLSTSKRRQVLPEDLAKLTAGSKLYFGDSYASVGKKVRGKGTQLPFNGHNLLRGRLRRQQPEQPGKPTNIFHSTERAQLLEQVGSDDFTAVCLEMLHNTLSKLEDYTKKHLPSGSIRLPSYLCRIELSADIGPLSQLGLEQTDSRVREEIHRTAGLLFINNQWKDNHCTTYRLSPRSGRKRPQSRNERTSAKVYRKRIADESYQRLEMVYENPRAEHPLLSPTDICEELRRLAEDAKSRIYALTKHSRIDDDENRTQEELLKTLSLYGLVDASNNLRWREFCRQLAERGVYDPAATDKGLRVRRETLRQKLAHPELGFIEKKPRPAGTGAGGIPFYSLRPNWKQRALAYVNSSNR